MVRHSSQDRITRSVIKIDFRNWNAGGTIADDEFDFRSVLTHEIGHAAGMGRGSLPGHFTDAVACPSLNGNPRSGDSTMCSGTRVDEIHKRTLESHDEHTIAAHY